MKEIGGVDLGTIKIHKKVLAEIVEKTIHSLKGVSLVRRDAAKTLSNILGMRYYPGVHIHVDKNNQVTIEVKICVLYGTNILESAQKVQEAVRQAIEKAVEIDLKDVNVNVQGIQRTDKGIGVHGDSQRHTVD